MKTKKTIVFYDDDTFYIKEIIQNLEEAGFIVKKFISADSLLRYIRKGYKVDLIVSEVTVHGSGNSFGGRRNEDYNNCAILLADELDKIPQAKGIKKIILSAWWAKNLGQYFKALKKDGRFSYVWKKSDILSKDFLEKITELLNN
ncbi:MAG: hypothetical protein WC606_00520 [Candidatus Absconditabacterales bacterium]|jgi:hypothetical protein